MENHQLILVIDFGGQYNHLIARRVRECGVYCEVKPYTVSIEEIKQKNPIGIIFTGGPNSVYVKDAPRIDPALYQLGIPILGICYGVQLIAQELGGHVTSPDRREYGRTETTRCPVESLLFGDQPDRFISWMSHTDYIDRLPEGFVATATTASCPTAAMENPKQKIYGLQMHPEVNHTEGGIGLLRNFLYNICGAAGDWSMKDYAVTAVEQIQKIVGDGKVLLALSGGSIRR